MFFQVWFVCRKVFLRLRSANKWSVTVIMLIEQGTNSINKYTSTYNDNVLFTCYSRPLVRRHFSFFFPRRLSTKRVGSFVDFLPIDQRCVSILILRQSVTLIRYYENWIRVTPFQVEFFFISREILEKGEVSPTSLSFSCILINLLSTGKRPRQMTFLELSKKKRALRDRVSSSSWLTIKNILLHAIFAMHIVRRRIIWHKGENV